MDQHRQKTISGFKWSAIGQVGTEASKFLIGILLARLLGPEAFGLIGMVLVFSGLANVILEFGLAEALIQRKEVKEEHWSTVFWLNICIGAVLALIFAGSAGVISTFYEEPELIPITYALTGIILLQTLSIIPRTQLTRNLEFKKLAKADIFGFAGSGLLALAAAFWGAGVWALVIQHISRVLIMTVVLWALNRWSPQFIWSRSAVKDLIDFSFYLFLNRFLGHISMNLDSLIVGKVVGKTTLGHYNRAFFFMIFPVNSLTNVITRVLFPSLSSIQDEKERSVLIFQKIIGVLSLLVFPLMVGLIVFSQQIVEALFGEEWMPMAPYMQVFALIGIAATLSRLCAIAIMSSGRKDLMFKMTMLEKPTVIIATLIGAIWGVWGILILKVGITIIIIYFKAEWAAASLGTKRKSIFLPTKEPLVSSLIMGTLCFGLLQALTFLGVNNPWIILSLGVPVGAIIYIAINLVNKSDSMISLLKVSSDQGLPMPERLKSMIN